MATPTTEQYDVESVMDVVYQRIYGLDLSKCTLIKSPARGFSTLEILISPGEYIPLPQFVEKSAQIITLDHMSTKDRAEEIVKRMNEQKPLPFEVKQAYLKNYVEMLRFWFTIHHNDRVVGASDTYRVYNGFPGYIDIAKLVKNPQKEIDSLNERLVSGQYAFTPGKAQVVGKSRLRLLNDFLAKHPIRDVEISTKIDPDHS
ncbi:MAG: hypothetical protein JSW08_03365 [archaeon]|nr:MAG: hypothetical protein JSW08_03365 [archaeon]